MPNEFKVSGQTVAEACGVLKARTVSEATLGPQSLTLTHYHFLYFHSQYTATTDAVAKPSMIQKDAMV